MEHAQRAVIGALLDALYARGLLSEAVRLRAADLVRSAAELPGLFQYPPEAAKEADGYECAQDTQ